MTDAPQLQIPVPHVQIPVPKGARNDDLIRPTHFAPGSATPPPKQRRLPIGALKYFLSGSLLALAMYYIATARSVVIDISPSADNIDISGGLHMQLRGVHLLWSGKYRIVAQRAGYETLDAPLLVTDEGVQRVHFNLQKLGGRVSFTSVPNGAQITLDGALHGTTPAQRVVLAPGIHEVRISALDYSPFVTRINVAGLGQAQAVHADLKPMWAWVGVRTSPAGAEVRLGERLLGTTSSAAMSRMRVPQGEQVLTVKLRGYKARSQRVQIAPGVAQNLPLLNLERADGLIEVRTQPADAAVSVDGHYRGQSPIELALAPGRSYQVQFLKPGFRATERTATPQAASEYTINVPLAPEIGNLIVNVTPADADVLIDGKLRGKARQTYALDLRPHVVEIRKAGFVAYHDRITPRPAFPQEIRATLLSLQDARRASTSRQIVTASGQKLRLIYPGTFAMGSSPRDAGRRPNETLHQVTLTRPYYLSVLEVSNGEFRKFESHTSGKFESVNLDEDHLPVVNVSWFQAARYCNWLSAQEHLAPFYDIKDGVVTGYDPRSTGYRLPTEAEWEFAARNTDTTELRFSWGSVLPPPDREGNYADRAATTLLGHIIVGYTDGYVGPAPVGRFPANAYGLRDMGGNVAEWVNDFYGPFTGATASDPMGPDKGEYFVIKGASWMKSSTTELRFAFRDYAEQGRADVGFRVARFAE